MKKVYSIKDTKGAFSEPFVSINDATASRDVRTLVNVQKGSQYALYPEDFELWYIGEFDEVTGLISGKPLECICRLITLKDEANA